MDSFEKAVIPLLHPSDAEEDVGTLLKTEHAGPNFPCQCALPATASRLIRKVVVVLLPSPIQRRLASHIYKPPRLHPTSYLDGLRGMHLSEYLPMFDATYRCTSQACSFAGIT